MTEQHKVRFKRDGQDYKTATRNGETWVEYNDAVDIFNKLKDEEIAAWVFKKNSQGKNEVVLEYKPELPDQTEEF